MLSANRYRAKLRLVGWKSMAGYSRQLTFMQTYVSSRQLFSCQNVVRHVIDWFTVKTNAIHYIN